MENIIICVLFFTLTGCAQKQMTRQEWLDNSTHYYSGVSQDEVIEATEKLLKLSDGDDYKFYHDENGFYAERPWLVYIVLAASTGTDYWLVDTKKEGKQVRVKLEVSRAENVITASPVVGSVNGAYAVTSSTMPGRRINGNALYSLFWSRLDYLLGKSEDWISCKGAERWKRVHDYWGNYDALCSIFNIKDNIPEGTIPKVFVVETPKKDFLD